MKNLFYVKESMFFGRKKRSNRTFKEIHKGVQMYFIIIGQNWGSIQGLKEKLFMP